MKKTSTLESENLRIWESRILGFGTTLVNGLLVQADVSQASQQLRFEGRITSQRLNPGRAG